MIIIENNVLKTENLRKKYFLRDSNTPNKSTSSSKRVKSYPKSHSLS